MKNKVKHNIITLAALAILVAPTLVYAAWWNPLSWNWSALFNTPPQTEAKNPSITVDGNNSVSVTPTTTKQNPTKDNIKVGSKSYPSTQVTIPATQLQSDEQQLQSFVKAFPEYSATNDPEGTKYTQLIQTANNFKTGNYYSRLKQAHDFLTQNTGSFAQQNTPPTPSGTLCNGKYWNACSSGNNFVCPSTGDAYCQIPQQNAVQNNNQAQIKALQQQILDIKQRYYSDSQNLKNSQTPNQKQAWDNYNNDQKAFDALQQNIPTSLQSHGSFQDALQEAAGNEMVGLGSKLQSDVYFIKLADQEKDAMLQALLNNANQKIAQLNLQIQQLQLNSQ